MNEKYKYIIIGASVIAGAYILSQDSSVADGVGTGTEIAIIVAGVAVAAVIVVYGLKLAI